MRARQARRTRQQTPRLRECWPRSGGKQRTNRRKKQAKKTPQPGRNSRDAWACRRQRPRACGFLARRPPGQKVSAECRKTACPHSCKIFSPRANVQDPGPRKSEKGQAFPIATGPGQSGKPCARAVPCACAMEAPRQKNAGWKACRGAPGPYMRQRCRIGAAHLLAQTHAETTLNCGRFCVSFLAGSYARARVRRWARPGVCARVFLAPPPGQESFGRYCVIPRAPSYARKIPASDFRQ